MVRLPSSTGLTQTSGALLPAATRESLPANSLLLPATACEQKSQTKYEQNIDANVTPHAATSRHACPNSDNRLDFRIRNSDVLFSKENVPKGRK